jgi:phage-related protein
MIPRTEDAPWQVELYPPGRNTGPVLKAILAQQPEMRVRIQDRLERLQEHGPFALAEVGQIEKVKGLKETLYEVKLRGKGGGSFRLLICVVDRTVVVVHAFPKKSMRLRRVDLKTAEQRAIHAHNWYERAER